MIETDFKCAELHLFNDDMSLCLFHRKFHMDKLRKQMNQQAFWYLLKTTFSKKNTSTFYFEFQLKNVFAYFRPYNAESFSIF